MESASSGLIDIVREFVDVHERMSVLFRRYRAGDLDFDLVRGLCDDTDGSPLFRLKERCHSLFRDSATAGSPMRREALFDLAVGSLFHEAMKFRENFYQREVYAPKVEGLRDQQDAGTDELFHEFEKILDGSSARIEEALQESEALVAHTANQLRVLLCDQQDGLVTRFLIEQRGRIEEALAQSLDSLLTEMHGSPLEAHVAAARSYLDSAHFGHALTALETARALDPERRDLERRLRYAEGMRHFLAGRYEASLASLEAWIGAGPDADEERFLSLAHSAISRIERLVKADEEAELVRRGQALAARMEERIGGSRVEAAGA